MRRQLEAEIRFLPRMQSDAHGFTVVEELRWRRWGGVVVDAWHVECSADAHGTYLSPDPRLFAVLDMTGGGSFELSDPTGGAAARHAHPFSMAYIPAGVAVGSRALGIRTLRHLDIHLPEPVLIRRFGKALDPDRVRAPRLFFEDAKLAAIVALLAGECAADEPYDDRYGEGLVDALLTALFSVRPERQKPRPSLSRGQLAQSLDYIDAHCFEPIRLHDLAAQLGLSETYFSHAFKASTGIPPSRWQMEARIRKIKALLCSENATLAEIAVSTGFSDQAHLTRTFKRLVGLTPSQWRRDGGGGRV